MHGPEIGLVLGHRVAGLQALPQPFALARRVIGVKACVGLFAQTPFSGHPEQHLIHRAIGIGVAHRGAGGLGDFHTEIDRGFIDQLQRPQGHAHQFRRVFHQRRFHPFGHHADAFVDVGNDTAVGVEEPRIVHHDGRLADLAHVIQRLGHRDIARGLAADDLD